MNREQWLNKVAREFIWPRIEKAGELKRPENWRVSVGFASDTRVSKRKDPLTQHAIGQTHNARQSQDGHWEVFISPVLTAGAAVATLIHELIHVVAFADGHRGNFKAIAKKVGLTGPMTATVAGEELAMDIADFMAGIQAYPHAPLKLQYIDPKTGKPKKPPGSRLIKVACPDCGYTIRTTRQWLDMGAPACPNEDCERHEHEMEEC